MPFARLVGLVFVATTIWALICALSSQPVRAGLYRPQPLLMQFRVVGVVVSLMLEACDETHWLSPESAECPSCRVCGIRTTLFPSTVL